MEPILTKYIRESNSYTLDFFLKHEGYQGLKKAIAMEPTALIEMVKASGLRGRGGAGVPTGMKRQIVGPKSPNPQKNPSQPGGDGAGAFTECARVGRNPPPPFSGRLHGRAASPAR